MKTAVTGGTGFIGSHLVKSLLEQNREVIVASDLSRLDSENLSSLGIKPADIELRRADLSDHHQALKAIAGADSVFHLAARIGNIQYLHDTSAAELAALQTNLIIDANVFRACLEKKVEKLIYASSVAVYPMDRQFSLNAVFSETELALQPGTYRLSLNPDGGYGWAKLVGELQLNQMEGIAIGIARIFNVYGENEPLGETVHVVGDLIRKAILYPKEEFRVWGSGEQTRDFLYVADCVEALLKLEEKASNPPVTINIGSSKATSIREVAKKIIETSGKNIEPIYDFQKLTGPISRTADITKAKALLSWQPNVNLDDGLRRTYFWIESRLKAKRQPLRKV